MAFSVGPQNGGNGRRGRRRGGTLGSMSEMNVVPLVDVVLVLLIIFMVTAHVMNSGITIEAPAVKQVSETVQDFPQVAVTRKGLIFLNGEPVKNINLLADDIKKKFDNPSTVYLLADKNVVWETPVGVMAELGAAKFKISVVTKPQDMPNKP